MYKRLLLASDGARESLVSLREGALIAQSFKAETHLLSVDRESPSALMASTLSGQQIPAVGRDLLDLGLHRLRQLGIQATGELVRGDPTQAIIDRVKRFKADLVVLGHRRQSFFERWWSGPAGGYIADGVPCSILIARDTISDEEFNLRLIKGSFQ